MKHKLSVTLLLISMFILTQLVGLIVVNHYVQGTLPYDLQLRPEDPQPSFVSLIFSFIIAFGLIFLLIKYQWKMFMRLWFLSIIFLSLAVSLTALLKIDNASTIALLLAIPLSLWKVFRPNVIIHNITEIFIYPGIGAIFVQYLTPASVIGLLILISLYDMWAVWHSGIMQKMAKFQMTELKIFGGFLLPSTSKRVKDQIAQLREKYRNKKIPKHIKNKKFKINLAILGGGDVVFPIITSGVFLASYGVIPALFIMAGSLMGLLYLFSITKKDTAYPAMPYISAGIFLGLLLWQVLF